MDADSLFFALLAPGAAALLALAVVFSLIHRERTAPTQPRNDTVRFRIADGVVIDRSGSLADQFPETDWGQLHKRLLARFPELPKDPPREPATLLAERAEAQDLLRVEPGRRWTDLTLSTDRNAASAAHSLFETARDLAAYRASLDAAPCPVWALDDTGNILWTNAAYNELATTFHAPGEAANAPLFDITPSDLGARRKTRLAVCSPDGTRTHWFDVYSEKVTDQIVNYAIDIDAVVHSEIAQRNFVQTLTKTFAHLSIGLAIFDRNRQLALFNPALIDLTALPADFLSLRPDLFSFFDRLRDRRMMPEPKNYPGWREQLNALVTEASHGQYSETWTLPSGLTYRVSGRPHPDGAVAFLFEDISAEISLTRRFRSEMEMGQSVLDCLPQAIAVFSGHGSQTMTNSRYDRLWPDLQPDTLNDNNINACMRVWARSCAPTHAWQDIRHFILERRNREPGTRRVRHTDGRSIDIRFDPLPGGATLLTFQDTQDAPQTETARTDANEKV